MAVAGEPGGQGSGWWTRDIPHSFMNKPGGTTGEQDHATQGSSAGNEASKTLAVKTCGDCGGGRNPQTHESPLERPTGS